MSEVQVGWYVVAVFFSSFQDEKLSGFFFLFNRLSEYAPTYFDLSSFPDGEMKRALERANKKSKGKMAQLDGSDKKTNPRKKAKFEA